MAHFYFDASTLVKYYIREPGSTWVKGLVHAKAPDNLHRSHMIVISDASTAESAAAFSVLYRMRRINRRTRDGAFRAFANHVTAGLWYVLPISTADFRRAAQLTQHHPLKGYDAVQLAVALRAHETLAVGGLSLVFVSGDRTLLSAAGAEGLATDNPFDHTAPQDAPEEAV